MKAYNYSKLCETAKAYKGNLRQANTSELVGELLQRFKAVRLYDHSKGNYLISKNHII